MTGFRKFDPKAFLNNDHYGEGQTLAGLATLAGWQDQHRYPHISVNVAPQGPVRLVQTQPVQKRTDTPAKAAKVAKILPALLDADDLRHRYEERAAICESDGQQDRPRAESRAWHEVAAIWYRQNGTRTRSDLCAGCGKPISESDEVLLMPHGERAHAGQVQRCVIAYGRRWKTEAAIALMAIGIPSPPK